MNTSISTIDQYIKGSPREVQPLLKQVCATIQKAAPDAVEAMKYGMPTFVYCGNLVHVAAWKNHIGLYPAPSAIKFFSKELAIYQTSKGAIQFPIDKPMPLRLITQIVKYRVNENLDQALMKKKLKTCAIGHHFVKSSDSPSCPICAREGKASPGFLTTLSAPAMRALENAGITTLKKLSRYTEKDILELHGMGPGSMPKLRAALQAEGLSFKAK